MNLVNLTDNNIIAIHLADRALSPIISSADLDTQYEQLGISEGGLLTQASALTSLTNTAVIAYDTSLRLGAGAPLTIMVETNTHGPILLSSYLNPQDVGKQEQLRVTPVNVSNNADRISDSHSCSTVNRDSNKARDINSNEDDFINNQIYKNNEDKHILPPVPPLLIASAVARNLIDADEINKAMTKLVKAGRECQKEWIKEHSEARADLLCIPENSTIEE